MTELRPDFRASRDQAVFSSLTSFASLHIVHNVLLLLSVYHEYQLGRLAIIFSLLFCHLFGPTSSVTDL